MFDKVHDIWVLDHAKGFDFGINKSPKVLVFIEDFHRIFVSCLVLSDLDLATGTFTKSFSYPEVI